MTIRGRVARWLEPPPAAKPQTYPGKVLGSTPTCLSDKRDTKLESYRNVYDQGGLVSEAVDFYPLMMLSNGYRVEGPRQKDAEQFLDDIDFESIAWKLIVDSLVVKVGLAEIVPGLDATKYPVARLDIRCPETFTEVRDDYGTLLGYQQTIGATYGSTRKVDVKPDAICRIDLGTPLIARAYDDIMRDADIAAGTAESIKRHGYPRYHIKVGQPGENIPDATIDAIGKNFEELKAKHEMVTANGVDILNIDAQGVPNTKLYNEWSVQRVCAALGVPEEALGLGRGVLTGELRFESFYNKVGTLQARFARQFNVQVLDKWAGRPDQAWIVFNDVSPNDETRTADLVQKLMTGPIDPWQIVTPEWCRKRLNISEDEYQAWESKQTEPTVSTPVVPVVPIVGEKPPPKGDEKKPELEKQKARYMGWN